MSPRENADAASAEAGVAVAPRDVQLVHGRAANESVSESEQIPSSSLDSAGVARADEEDEEDMDGGLATDGPVEKAAWYVLPVIGVSQLFGTSLWFAPNAVVSEIDAFGTRELSLLTSLVQVGFVLGTFALTYFAVADRVNAELLFSCCAILASALNAVCAASDSLALWAAMRTLVGVCLAGIYPVGLKIAAKRFPEGLGARMGWLIAALTLGTAFPWLVRSIGAEEGSGSDNSEGSADDADEGGSLPPDTTLLVVSAMALFGGVLLPLALLPSSQWAPALASLRGLLPCRQCRAAPPVGAAKPLAFGAASMREIWASRAFRTAAFAYWAHMWELYALWAYLPVLVEAHADAVGSSVLTVELTTFLAIAVGAVSSVLFGVWSLRAGRGVLPGSAVAGQTALIVSGACCLVAPFYRSLSAEGFLALLLVWGFSVIADSGQFSSLCAEFAPAHLVGTALTLTVCVGFGITIVSIQLVGALIKADVDPGLALLVLFPGPAVGVVLSYVQWPLHHLVYAVVPAEGMTHSAGTSTAGTPTAGTAAATRGGKPAESENRASDIDEAGASSFTHMATV